MTAAPRLEPGPASTPQTELRAAAARERVSLGPGTRRRLAIQGRLDQLEQKMERAQRNADASKDEPSRRRFERRAESAEDEWLKLIEELDALPGSPELTECRRCIAPVFEPYFSSLCSTCRRIYSAEGSN